MQFSLVNKLVINKKKCLGYQFVNRSTSRLQLIGNAISMRYADKGSAPPSKAYTKAPDGWIWLHLKLLSPTDYHLQFSSPNYHLHFLLLSPTDYHLQSNTYK